MKITAWSIVFVLVVFSFSFINRVEISNKMEIIKEEVRYNNAIDEATMDSTYRLMQQSQNLNKQTDISTYTILSSLDKFFESFSLSFGIYGGEITQSMLKRYIPVLAVIGYDSLYIYSLDYVTDDDGVVYLEHTLKPKISYAIHDTTKMYNTLDILTQPSNDIYVKFSLDKTVEVIKKNDVDNIDLIGEIVDYRHYYDIYLRRNATGNSVWTSREKLANGDEVVFNCSVSDDFVVTKSCTYNGDTLEYKKYFVIMNKVRYLYEEWNINDTMKHRSISLYTEASYEFTNSLRDIDPFYALPGNYLTEGNPENTGMIDPFTGVYYVGNYNKIKNTVITNIVLQKIESYILRHNQFVTSNDVSYTFLLPNIESSEWDRAISDVSVFAFVQGINMLGQSYYNNYGLSGAKIVDKEIFYGLPVTRSTTLTTADINDNRFPIYYSSYKFTRDNRYLLEVNNAKMYYHMSAAANDGYFPDLHSNKPIIDDMQQSLNNLTVTAEEISTQEEYNNGLARIRYHVFGNSVEDYNIQIEAAAFFFEEDGVTGPQDANQIIEQGTQVSILQYNYETGYGEFIVNRNGSYLFAVREKAGTAVRVPNSINITQILTPELNVTYTVNYDPTLGNAQVVVVSDDTTKFYDAIWRESDSTEEFPVDLMYTNTDGNAEAVFTVPENGQYYITVINEYNNSTTTELINVNAIQNLPPYPPTLTVSNYLSGFQGNVFRVETLEGSVDLGVNIVFDVEASEFGDPEGDNIYFTLTLSKDGASPQSVNPNQVHILGIGHYVLTGRAYDDGDPVKYSTPVEYEFDIITNEV